MYRVMSLVLLLAVFVGLASTAPTSAADNQPFFKGYWRCNNGETLNVTPSFGPWMSFQSKSVQAYAAIDSSTGSHWRVGIDSDGGFWSLTSPGWKGQHIVFTGTYTSHGTSKSMQQTITRNTNTAITVQTVRNGAVISTIGCNK
jgi:hypothetical protein